MSFEEFWKLHNPQPEYAQMHNYCKKIWDALPEEKQKRIYRNVEEKKKNNLFVDYNPLYAIQKNGNPPRPHRQQQLSYAQYYDRYGTTEERDGWQRVHLENEQKTIYVKQ